MTIQFITARLDHPQAAEANKQLYCFDAPEHGLVAEPFVASATMAIHVPLRWTLGFDHFFRDGIYAMSQQVLLHFTDDSAEAQEQLPINFSTPIVQLTLDSPSGGGHSYSWKVLHPEEAMDAAFFESEVFSNNAWLCPALLHYFPDGAPQEIWVSIQEDQPPVFV